VSSIERKPASVQEHFEPRTEIHRCGVARDPYIAKITRAVSGWNIHASAQGDG
jgi:hypothetical protein